ncbi:MAG: ATP-binding cassette domain-containing protein [bacterium]|nr:ATP-binding cassette domain-containing protein [bacterium]
MGPRIQARGLTLRAGDFRLAGIDFEIDAGEYVVLMGRTGSGKTCLLEALCGLLPLEGGSIAIDGRDVTDASPGERGIGYVPQDGALFHSMTVAENLGFALFVQGRAAAERTARAGELAALLGIESLLERRPQHLSGGERQRVALGRALAAEPRVLCLDEPLSAVDEEARDALCTLLADVRERTGVSVLHVTHSRVEAERLGDRVLQLESGSL